jgi:TusA-related sulfurtransferase
MNRGTAMQQPTTLDAVGKKCPFPMMQLQKYLADHPGPQQVIMIVTDANAVDDMYALQDLGEVQVLQVSKREKDILIEVARS